VGSRDSPKANRSRRAGNIDTLRQAVRVQNYIVRILTFLIIFII
jgi:hypothetical protein